MLVLMAGVLYFYMERGGNQYGPRFHYEAFPFAALFVAANVFREREFSEKPPRDRWLFALLAVSVMVMPALVHDARRCRAAGHPRTDGSLHHGSGGGAA